MSAYDPKQTLGSALRLSSRHLGRSLATLPVDDLAISTPAISDLAFEP
jgi:hypothetical protein